MKNKPISIMLVDNDSDNNFFHERAIKKYDPNITVVSKTSGLAALEFLKSTRNILPDIIFLDINMPGMNGWEFMDEYNLLEKEFQNRTILLMLTNSENPDDQKKAKSFNYISEYITKPLTKELFEIIKNKYLK